MHIKRDWTHQCSRCKNSFETIDLFLNHKMTCRPKPRTKKCLICKKFVEREKYQNHILHFHQLSTKNHHQIRIKPTKITALTCDICMKKFCGKSSLSIHQERVHDKKRTYYSCDICGQNFLEEARVSTHKKRVHLKEFDYHCDQCGKGFVCVSEVNIHVKTVHNKEITLAPCTVPNCNKTFRSKSSLNYHLHTHLDNKPQYACEVCGKLYDHPSLFRKHQNLHKFGPKTYTCQVCKKEVTSRASLNFHMRTHTGERPFICEHCGQGFVRKSLLKVHYVVHTKEKPHGCKICSKRFTQRGTLSAHIKNCHSDEEKPSK